MAKSLGKSHFCGSVTLATGVEQCLELATGCGCSTNRIMRILSADIGVDPNTVTAATTLRAALGPECAEYGLACGNQIAVWDGNLATNVISVRNDSIQRMILLGCTDSLVASENVNLSLLATGDAQISVDYRVCYELIEVSDAEFFKVSTTGNF